MKNIEIGDIVICRGIAPNNFTNLVEGNLYIILNVKQVNGHLYVQIGELLTLQRVAWDAGIDDWFDASRFRHTKRSKPIHV